MIIDSHCHLDLLDYTSGDSLAAVLQRARMQGVGKFLCVGTRLDHVQTMLDQVQAEDDVWCSVGEHPNEASDTLPTLDALCRWGAHPKIIAIGETGLDYYRSAVDSIALQQTSFLIHIEAAKKLKKPLIIHTRQARADTLALLQSSDAMQAGGVLHCFTEDWDMAKHALDMGLYISLSGIVTFKKAVELQAVAKQIPLSRLLIETDSPYLAPVPMRGKQNEPAYVYYVAKFLAELRGESLETITQATTQNFYDLFQIRH